jgi:hypothetical protein
VSTLETSINPPPDPVSRTRFRAPVAAQLDPLDPATTTLTEPAAPAGGEPAEPGRVEPKPADTQRSTTSSKPRSRDEVAEGIAAALATVLIVSAAGARLLLRRRGLDVRKPTKREQKAIVEPLSRIGARHVTVDMAPDVIKSLWDAAEAFGEITNYLEEAVRRPGAGAPTPAEGDTP